MIETADDGDRPSITEVNGSVARFEMAYNPNPDDRFVFGPPLWQRLPSLLFVGFAGALGVAATFIAYNSGIELVAPSLHRQGEPHAVRDRDLHRGARDIHPLGHARRHRHA